MQSKPVCENEPASRTLVVKQMIKYLLVGGSTALIELALFSALVYGTPLSAGMSNIIAVLVATAINFILNRTKTFESSSNVFRSIVLYVLLFVLNTTFSTICVSLAAAYGINTVIVKLATMVCIVAWNFVLYRRIIFV